MRDLSPAQQETSHFHQTGMDTMARAGVIVMVTHKHLEAHIHTTVVRMCKDLRWLNEF